uniref:Uncharacterized protein n=1 Tax=Megaselia scalaris TaxID=36166 RepID=T1H0G3_MEGSC
MKLILLIFFAIFVYICDAVPVSTEHQINSLLDVDTENGHSNEGNRKARFLGGWGWSGTGWGGWGGGWGGHNHGHGCCGCGGWGGWGGWGGGCGGCGGWGCGHH